MLLLRKRTEPSPNRKFAPSRVHAVKRIGVDRSGSRRWAGAWRCSGPGPEPRQSLRCRRRARGRRVGGGGLRRHPGGAASSRHCTGPGAGGVVAGAFADEDGVAHPVGDGGDIRAAVAIKHAAAGGAVKAGQTIGTGPRLGIPAGAVKAFLPAVAADVVAVRHRGDGAGEAAVVDGECLLVGIRGALEDRQRLLGDRRVDALPTAWLKLICLKTLPCSR